MNSPDAPKSFVLARRGVAALPRFYERGVQLGLHAHAEAQLLFAASGVMQVTTPRGRWLVPPRRAVWLPPRLAHAVDMVTDLDMRSLYLAADWVAEHPESPRLGRPFVVSVGTLLRALVLALFAAPGHDSGPPAPVDAAPSRATLSRTDLLASLILFELVEAEDSATFMPLPADPRARRVAEAILADPAGGRDLADLARAAGASARTITRLFPDETDLTFKAWRQRARILASVSALESGMSPLASVAARFGFSGTAAFGQAFRQVLGVTPGAFTGHGRRASG